MNELTVRTCGECTMCCKILGISELEKPAHRWCPHCDKGKGCKVYDTRPQACQQFQCLWLAVSSDVLPDDIRPDRSHVVIVPDALTQGEEVVPLSLVLFVQEGYEAAYKAPYFQALAHAWPGPVVVRYPKGKRTTAINEHARTLVRSTGVDIEVV